MVQGELFDVPRLVRVLKEHRIEQIVHTAAMSHPALSLDFPIATFAANVEGTLSLLETARLADVRRVVNFSSEAVYGATAGPLTEEVPVKPSTMDQSGCPQSRWMATMSFDDFPDLYTLTSAKSRKVAQIQRNPMVHWMFSNQDLSFIVNLTGRAEIYLHEADAMKRIWRQIAE